MLRPLWLFVYGLFDVACPLRALAAVAAPPLHDRCLQMRRIRTTKQGRPRNSCLPRSMDERRDTTRRPLSAINPCSAATIRVSVCFDSLTTVLSKTQYPTHESCSRTASGSTATTARTSRALTGRHASPPATLQPPRRPQRQLAEGPPLQTSPSVLGSRHQLDARSQVTESTNTRADFTWHHGTKLCRFSTPNLRAIQLSKSSTPDAPIRPRRHAADSSSKPAACVRAPGTLFCR